MKQKSIKNIRQEFKDNGVFYTPLALAERLKSYVDIDIENVYDPTCGAGNLLSVFHENVKKYGQELDAEQLSLIDLENAARKSFLERLRKELDFEKMVCEMEGISMQPFLNAIRKILREYEKPKVKEECIGQMNLSYFID